VIVGNKLEPELVDAHNKRFGEVTSKCNYHERREAQQNKAEGLGRGPVQASAAGAAAADRVPAGGVTKAEIGGGRDAARGCCCSRSAEASTCSSSCGCSQRAWVEGAR